MGEYFEYNERVLWSALTIMGERFEYIYWKQVPGLQFYMVACLFDTKGKAKGKGLESKHPYFFS